MERAGSPLRRRRRAPAAGEIMPVNLTAHRMPCGAPRPQVQARDLSTGGRAGKGLVKDGVSSRQKVD